MKMEKVWCMPNKNTFSIPPIAEFIKQEMNGGLWIDPYANTNKFANITNDLNSKFDTDYHLDAFDFLKQFDDNSIDGVLFDPPYSARQLAECYESVGKTITQFDTQSVFWTKQKQEIARIVKTSGKVLCFGWNSNGIGINLGFQMNRILLVAHGGMHNDTICTSETKMSANQKKLFFI